MNKKILQKLIREATTTSFNQDGAGFHTFSKEKFAELLVQECIGVCLDRHHTYHTWKWDNELDSDGGPRDCARSIQEHFGVEA